MNLPRQRRGSVALMTAIMAPVMVMLMSMGIEVTFWSVNQIELQRIADVAAFAGATNFLTSNNQQTATGVADDMAEINGISSTSRRSWNAATETLTDGSVIAQVVAGVQSTSDTAIQVTVKRSIATTFSAIFPSTPASITVSATAIAEIVSVQGSGPQPCILTLGGPTTATDVTLSGSGSITANGCSVRTNGSLTISGGSTVTADGTYLGGVVNEPVWDTAAISGGTYANDGTVADPYASYTPLVNAFAQLSSGGTSVNIQTNTTQTINPGTYSSINVNSQAGSGTLTMNPGLYIVNGGINMGNGGKINGSGVTIVASGSLLLAGSNVMNVTAPLSGAASGIPGIVFASKSTTGMSISNAATAPFAGVIYYPNGSITYLGSAGASGNGCNIIIASSISISGASSMAANCSSYGTKPFTSGPTTQQVVLVE